MHGTNFTKISHAAMANRIHTGRKRSNPDNFVSKAGESEGSSLFTETPKIEAQIWHAGSRSVPDTLKTLCKLAVNFDQTIGLNIQMGPLPNE